MSKRSAKQTATNIAKACRAIIKEMGTEGLLDSTYTLRHSLTKLIPVADKYGKIYNVNPNHLITILEVRKEN